MSPTLTCADVSAGTHTMREEKVVSIDSLDLLHRRNCDDLWMRITLSKDKHEISCTCMTLVVLSDSLQQSQFSVWVKYQPFFFFLLPLIQSSSAERYINFDDKFRLHLK